MTYKDIEPAQVDSLIAEGPISLLDMRDLNSFNNEHMPDAIPANDFTIEKLIKNNKKQDNVLVYCYLGNSSRDLSNFLTKLGFKNVYNLVGGFTAWKKFKVQNGTQNLTDPVSAWLVEKGFDPTNLKDRIENANTPLMEAAIEGNLKMVNTLLSRGADADLVNDDENIALWFACCKAKSLIRSGEGYMHFEKRIPNFHSTGDPEYAYVLLLESAFFDPVDGQPGYYIVPTKHSIYCYYWS